MLRAKLLVSAAVLSLGFAALSPAMAQRVVVFGDSLSDTGNAAAAGAVISPAGRWSNGTNWVDQLYGGGLVQPPGSVAYAVGSKFNFIPSGNVLDYAVGGGYAGVGNLGSGLAPGTAGAGPGTTDQIALFAKLGGKFAPTDTATLWGGANNFFYIAPSLTPANASTLIGQTVTYAVTSEVGNLQSLVGLGAKKVIVFNLPDLGSTPAATNPALGGSLAGSQAASAYTGAFNSNLASGVGQLANALPGTNFIQADINALFKLVLANPAAFGFNPALTNQACSTSSTVFIANCPGYIFANGVHPTQLAYSYIAQYVGALSNAAPALQQTSRLGEVGIYTNEMITNAVFDRLSGFISGAYPGKNGPYFEVLGTYATYGSSGGTPGLSMQIGGARAGVDKRTGDTLAGASVSIVDGSQSAGAVKSDIQSFRGDVYGTMLFGNAYVSADGGISSLDLAGIKRDTGFPTVVTQGHTSGFVATAAAEAGYKQPVGTMLLIPSVRATYFHSQVNGYDESAPILAMSFAEHDIDTVMLAGKVRAVTNVGWIGLASVAFAEVGYEGFVSTSQTALKSTFVNNTALPTIVNAGDPTSPGILGKLGLSSQLKPNMFLDVQYGIAVHDDGGQTHSGDLRLKATY